MAAAKTEKVTVIDQLAVSTRKRLAERSSEDKKTRDFDRDMALELYEHLVVDVIEEDYPEWVFDRLLDTLFIALDAMTNRLTLDQVKKKVKASK